MSSIINLELDQGTAKNILLTWLDASTNLPTELTGFTATLQVRKYYGDYPVLLELSTANSKIDLTGGPGNVVLIFNNSDTESMTEYDCVYELIFTRPDGSKVSFTKGKFILLQRIVSNAP